MSYDIEKCVIKKVWCGNGAIPVAKANQYSRKGTRTECLKQGIGAGVYSERRKHLPANSLQQIPYVGEKMEQKFKDAGIKTTDDLVKKLQKKTPEYKKVLLQTILRDKKNKLNKKAYNSTIKYLYEKGILNLPSCKNIDS